MARYPPSFTSFIAPEIDFSIALYRVFDGAAGLGEGRRVQNHQVEALPPPFPGTGRRSKTSAHWKETVEERPFRAAFSRAWRMARSEASTPRTLFAPASPAFRAKEPVWVKQSSTVSGCIRRQRFCTARRLYFWSRKNPVFCSVLHVYLVAGPHFPQSLLWCQRPDR